MKFGRVGVSEAAGALLAHSLRREGLVLKKGRLLDEADVTQLQRAGVDDLVVARLEADDIGEDEAARRLAAAIGGANVRVEAPFTGRSNLFASAAGVLRVSVAQIDAVNEVDERITVATLPPWRSVVANEMVATVKIIPFSVPSSVLAQCVLRAAAGRLEVHPWRALRVGVVSTLSPGLKKSVVDKTLRVLEQRLAPADAKIVIERRAPHEAPALTQALAEIEPQCDLLIVFGASAITDRRDVIPAALEAAGGAIRHLGMPVDPGNLLLVGTMGTGSAQKFVLGAPGCARSPAENGFDWVLQRLLAGIDVASADIARMGAGGLLMEIVQRGQLRASDHGGESG